jgi:diguanylate cyclase (GGDEF)-like protein
LLGYAMVIIATDRVHNELLEFNERLRTASEQLDWAAKTDSLTGVYNRRAWDDHRTELLASNSGGALAIIDVNNLKTINDQLGHTYGDQAIQTVARTLLQHTRMADRIYRMGGDEFLVIMRQANVFELEERLSEVDDRLHLVRLGEPTLKIRLTIAWGATEFEHAHELEQAIRIADEQMYACKKARKGHHNEAWVADGDTSDDMLSLMLETRY